MHEKRNRNGSVGGPQNGTADTDPHLRSGSSLAEDVSRCQRLERKGGEGARCASGSCSVRLAGLFPWLAQGALGTGTSLRFLSPGHGSGAAGEGQLEGGRNPSRACMTHHPRSFEKRIPRPHSRSTESDAAGGAGSLECVRAPRAD